MHNLKNHNSIINIRTSQPTFKVSFLSFIRSLSDISINPLSRVPGGLGRRRVAECHRNVIIRPPETFAGWKSHRVFIECIRHGSGRAMCILNSLPASYLIIQRLWDDPLSARRKRQNSEKQNFKPWSPWPCPTLSSISLCCCFPFPFFL